MYSVWETFTDDQTEILYIFQKKIHKQIILYNSMSSQTPVLTTVFLPSEPVLNECYYIVILALPCTLCPVIHIVVD